MQLSFTIHNENTLIRPLNMFFTTCAYSMNGRKYVKSPGLYGRTSQLQVCMEERPKNSNYIRLLHCHGNKKAHIQVGQFSIQVCPKYDVFTS